LPDGRAGPATSPPPPAEPTALPAPPPKALPEPPVIDIALGGGAARGFAPIGVIQVLDVAGIHTDLMVGASAGSLVAAMHTSGKSGIELASLAQSMGETAITDWSFPGRGLIRGEALASYVREHTGGRSIEPMKLPLGLVVTDLDNGHGILLREAEIVLRPKLAGSSSADFSAPARAIQAGREATQAMLGETRLRIPSQTRRDSPKKKRPGTDRAEDTFIGDFRRYRGDNHPHLSRP
jgi:predicted acylesterase/phospholipase RssA